MKIKDIYQLIIQEGMAKDPRGTDVEKHLENINKEEQDLKEDAKIF